MHVRTQALTHRLAQRSKKLSYSRALFAYTFLHFFYTVLKRPQMSATACMGMDLIVMVYMAMACRVMACMSATDKRPFDITI